MALYHGKFQLLTGNNFNGLEQFLKIYTNPPKPPTSNKPVEICKCIWETKCNAVAEIDGWCYACNETHREGR